MFEKFHPLGPTSFTSRGINLSQHNYVLSESWFLLLSSTIFSTRIKITSIRDNCNSFFSEDGNGISSPAPFSMYDVTAYPAMGWTVIPPYYF